VPVQFPRTGAEVRRILDRLKLTQAALARERGVSRVTVARWETGVYAIPESTARLLQRIRNERLDPRGRST
jgi:DNA-binding transcriptional regulator YiaG